MNQVKTRDYRKAFADISRGEYELLESTRQEMTEFFEKFRKEQHRLSIKRGLAAALKEKRNSELGGGGN